MKTFYQWLTSKENRNRNSIVGDLARDAYKDEGFIAHSHGIRVLRRYLKCIGACSGCMDALDAAYMEFKAYRARQSDHKRA